MPVSNTAQSFGSVTRILHWLTALLILTAIPLGVIANDMDFSTSEALAQKAQYFSLHKTLGVAAFAVAVLRILWALTQTHPAPLHPDRRAETWLAAAVHWMLYLSLVVVPLSGWIHHAATSGFAPILWPLGQNLPLVPKSEAVAATAASFHFVFTKVLIASILLHIAGALKHHLFDKDATLRRMISGAVAPSTPQPSPSAVIPALTALAIYAAGAGLAIAITVPAAPGKFGQPLPAQTQSTDPTTGPTKDPTTGNWQVQSGALRIAVRQLGTEVSGQFDRWTANITFDDTVPSGSVRVEIDVTSLTLGSVTKQATSADFLDAANHPTAVFEATLEPILDGYEAQGTLTLRGITVPLNLSFGLNIDGDRATMSGTTKLDRRAFGIGEAYPDEKTVGFSVEINTNLIATRIKP